MTFDRILAELTGAAAMFERSDADVLALEGLQPAVGLRSGTLPPAALRFEENGLRIRSRFRSTATRPVSIWISATTARCARSLASGREVLDCFCYTGAFTASMSAGGAASVTAVDSSADSLAAGAAHICG